MKESCKEVKNEHLLLFIVPWILLDPSPSCFSIGTMEDGGVDRTVIECRQNQLGQMTDFPPLLTFDL